MTGNKSIIIRVDNEIIDSDINDIDKITIDYNLEDVKDFQVKKSSEALSLKFPATLRNQRIFNTANNFSIEKSENGEVRKFSVEINGDDIFIGKCILSKVHLRGDKPLYFEVNAFGNNADWILTLKESTLYDFVKMMPNHINNYKAIERTWDFPNNLDVYGKMVPYVFAPVRYNLPIDAGFEDKNNEFLCEEGSYSIFNMKPSISIKWLLEQSFKRVGFSIKSEFLNTEYFKRLVMPWTFGDFLTTEGSKYDVHKFLAVGRKKIDFSTRNEQKEDFLYSEPQFTVSKEERQEAFENNSGSFITKTGEIMGKGVEYFGFKYLDNFNFGPLLFNFEFEVEYQYHKSKIYEITLYYQVERNGIKEETKTETIFSYNGSHNSAMLTTLYHIRPIAMNAGDKVLFWISLKVRRADGNIMLVRYLNVKYFKIKSIVIPKDGEVIFDNFTVFQKYKTLDFIRGICDLFNLSVQTNPTQKEVLIEPTHDYVIEGEKKKGFFSNNIIDWTEKQDYSQTSILELFNNASRNYVMRFKDDSTDVEISKIKDYFNVNVGCAKYVFSERFKEDNKIFENRFFSPTMHCKATTRTFNIIKDENGKEKKEETPFVVQMVMIKTSDDIETKNTISEPKIAYYKGLVSDAGQWAWRGKKQEDYPFMFAVNYNRGGEKDPILSYSDENIDNGVVGKGLLRTFFLQRMAILNNGQVLSSPMVLTSSDVKNWYHREYIGLNGNKWEIINIKEYSVVENETAYCTFRKWVPISERDINNVFPSNDSIKSGNFNKHNEFDEKIEKDLRYFRLMEFLQQKRQQKTPKINQQ